MTEKYKTFTEYINMHAITPNEEDYMEMIYRISLTKSVTNKEIAHNLHVKPASVTKMMKKLASKYLVCIDEEKKILLTEKGKTIGEKLLRRHDIILMFLKNLGISADLLTYTEKIEHIFDDVLLEKINILNDYFSKNVIKIENV